MQVGTNGIVKTYLAQTLTRDRTPHSFAQLLRGDIHVFPYAKKVTFRNNSIYHHLPKLGNQIP